MITRTFGEKAFDFYNTLVLPSSLPKGIIAIDPLANHEARECVRIFFSTFFNDVNKRVFVLGINPGRFGSGVTGVTFTDPIALQECCGIENPFPKRRELSSEFVYTFIEQWGGAKKFYYDFFLTAVSPIGFTNRGLNYNYYDDKAFFQLMQPFIVKTLQSQCSLGAQKVAILFGSGKNQKSFTELNNEHHFFKKVYILEHPRYIMQYRRKYIQEYLKKYQNVFAQALLAVTMYA